MLETVEFPGGRPTTRIGFGCSGLMGGLSERESLRLLETAFEEGIRHFDVAPSYGHGFAERCLGKFLRGKADQVTIATKYGILPPGRTQLLEAARITLRPLARKLPAIRRRLAHAAAGLKTKAQFNAKEARQSLEQSLRELGLGQIDLLLLHEPDSEDLGNPAFLRAFRQFQAEGRIGAFGIGAERARIEALWHQQPDFCRVLQFEGSALGPPPEFPGAFCILHRAVSGAFHLIHSALVRDSSLARRWSNAVDADLLKTEVLAALLLQTALLTNPGGMVLFSSRSSSHIQSNIRAADDVRSRASAQRLLELLTSNRGDLPEMH